MNAVVGQKNDGKVGTTSSFKFFTILGSLLGKKNMFPSLGA